MLFRSTQFAPFAVKGKQEEHFRHTVKQADADTEQAEGKTQFGNHKVVVCVYWYRVELLKIVDFTIVEVV